MSGSLFQSTGPLTQKDLSANVFLVVIGTASLFVASVERRSMLLGSILVNSDCKYKGASPFSVLNTRDRILC